VFPCNPRSKIPAIIKGWRNMATADTEFIDRWWRANPAYNIGVVCGKKNNILVLDPDGDRIASAQTRARHR
jgi:hypothetical protein